MNLIIKHSFLILLVFFFEILSAQDLSSDIAAEIAAVKTEKYHLIDAQKLLQYNHKTLLDSLKNYDNNFSSDVRYNVQLLEYKIAKTNPADSQIVQEVVYRLARALSDTSTRVRQNAAKKLLTFSEKDFNDRADRYIIKNLDVFVQSKEIYTIIGLANIVDLKDEMLSTVKYYKASKLSDFNSSNWGMHMALARMGNTESINYCITGIDNYSDAVQKYTLLIKDLAYIKNKQAVLLLRKYLDYTTLLPSESVGVKGTPYNHYALDVLVSMLEDFPVKSEGKVYTDNDLQLARDWIDRRSDFTFVQ